MHSSTGHVGILILPYHKKEREKKRHVGMTNSWLFVRKSSCLAPWKISVTDVTAMVNQTGGNRSGLTGFGFGLGRYQTVPNLKFKFELKK